MSAHPRLGGESVLELVQTLIRANTVNPPGGEAAVANMLAKRLEQAGLDVEVVPLAPGRAGLVALTHPSTGTAKPWLCLTGHLDTVPFGDARWRSSPVSAEIDGDRLYGRGSSDMKAGVAALVWAVEEVAHVPSRRAGIALALTASEETGCQGAASIAARLPPIGGLVVAEPTANRVLTAHKGAAWFECEAQGVAAHGSAPERGVNAIYAMARGLLALDGVRPDGPHDSRLGLPTVSVGTIKGGTTINAVPDRCCATVDIRTVPGMDADDAERWLKQTLSAQAISVRRTLELACVATAPSSSLVATVAGAFTQPPSGESGASYFTDASVLAPGLGGPPVVICGPGDPEQAHQVDESCSIGQLEFAADGYTDLCRKWIAG